MSVIFCLFCFCSVCDNSHPPSFILVVVIKVALPKNILGRKDLIWLSVASSSSPLLGIDGGRHMKQQVSTTHSQSRAESKDKHMLACVLGFKTLYQGLYKPKLNEDSSLPQSE